MNKPCVTADIYGIIGRGVKDIQSNDKGELLFIMTDGRIINFGVISGSGGSYTLPIATSTKLGGVKIGTNLSITSDGIVSVSISNTINNEEKPVTSKAVNDAIGNVETLLANL